MAVDPKFSSSQKPSMAKTSEPNRSKSYNPKKPHITESPITKSNWYKHVNWLNVYLIVGIPFYGMIQAFWTPLRWQTLAFSVAYYFMTGLGITAGELGISSPSSSTFLLTFLKAIIDFGHIHPTPPHSLSEYFLLLSVEELLKDP